MRSVIIIVLLALLMQAGARELASHVAAVQNPLDSLVDDLADRMFDKLVSQALCDIHKANLGSMTFKGLQTRDKLAKQALQVSNMHKSNLDNTTLGYSFYNEPTERFNAIDCGCWNVKDGILDWRQKVAFRVQWAIMGAVISGVASAFVNHYFKGYRVTDKGPKPMTRKHRAPGWCMDVPHVMVLGAVAGAIVAFPHEAYNPRWWEVPWIQIQTTIIQHAALMDDDDVNSVLRGDGDMGGGG